LKNTHTCTSRRTQMPGILDTLRLEFIACHVQLVLCSLSCACSLMYILQLVFCYCSLARFTRRVLTQYLKDTVRGAGPPPGSPIVSQPVPPASGDQFPKPEDPKQKFPSDRSQAKASMGQWEMLFVQFGFKCGLVAKGAEPFELILGRILG
jgi:hypothetical protein